MINVELIYDMQRQLLLKTDKLFQMSIRMRIADVCLRDSIEMYSFYADKRPGASLYKFKKYKRILS